MSGSRGVACDVLVAGSGAGGLAAAVTARILGLEVLVVEKSAVFGGTTAWSGGWLWIPGNPHAARAHADGPVAQAREYLVHELGSAFDAARVDAFLDAGPRMVEFFERETHVRFAPGLQTPDFHSTLPGAAVGRVLCALPFDGRELGGLLDKLRRPLRCPVSRVPRGEDPAAWLIADRPTLRRYGLGYAKPLPFMTGAYVRSGYLVRATTPEALAQACGFDATGFCATLDGYNRGAREGRDDAFGRGSTPFGRFGGDAGHSPNPCVAPIEVAPFFAVKVFAGSLGTFAGVKTDAHARALGAGGAPIPGLYAAGNDMASVMAGCHPSGGITLGPAMTFGYLAPLDLASAAHVHAPTAVATFSH